MEQTENLGGHVPPVPPWFLRLWNVCKSRFKIRQSKIGLKEIPTPKLGRTMVMTVPKVCIFVNLCRETTVPPYLALLSCISPQECFILGRPPKFLRDESVQEASELRGHACGYFITFRATECSQKFQHKTARN